MKMIIPTLACYILSFGLAAAVYTYKQNFPGGLSGGAQTIDSFDYHVPLIHNHEAWARMLEKKSQE